MKYKLLIAFFICCCSHSIIGQTTKNQIDSLLSEIELSFKSIYNCDSLEKIGKDSLLAIYADTKPFHNRRMMIQSDTMWNRAFKYNFMNDIFFINGQCAEWTYVIERLFYEENIKPFRQKLINLIKSYELDCLELLNFNDGRFRMRHPPQNWLYTLHDKLKDLLHSTDYINMSDIEIFKRLHQNGWIQNHRRYGFVNRNFELKLLSKVIKSVPDDLIIKAISESSKVDRQIYFNAYCHRKTKSEKAELIKKLEKIGYKFYTRDLIYDPSVRGKEYILDPTGQ